MDEGPFSVEVSVEFDEDYNPQVVRHILSLDGKYDFHALIERYRKAFQAGRKEYLFHAIELCGAEKKVLPDWVRDAFYDSWGRFQLGYPNDIDEGGERTLGGAFGIAPRILGEDEYKHEVLAKLIATFVYREKAKGRRDISSREFFEEAAELVAKKTGEVISAMTAERLFADICRNRKPTTPSRRRSRITIPEIGLPQKR